ncbi:MAG: peptidoglycan editing factor PgeF [Clostridiales bacterium]|nr:peptidoglycan editing factor PgeF [Clostridiales bacterium]
MNIKYINDSRSTHIHNKDGVEYITFDKLDKAGVTHAFSTRMGGVSEGYLGSMNLSFHRGDDPDRVMENHRRFARAVGYDYTKLVFSDQVHKTDIYKVDENDAGKGIVKESDIKEIDGLATNVPGIPLMTFYADCVPVFFFDPVNRVVAMNHSGWKGTVAKISKCMLDKLNKWYGTDPGDVICAVGPSICKECYEVSKDVADQFKAAYTEDEVPYIVFDKYNGKYLLDLHRANYFNLVDAGVKPENIDVTDICTCCNSGWLFSHRASKGMRGNLGAVIMLN